MKQDPYADWDAAYVLGALSPQERREYERHLGLCPDCKSEVTELAGMPAVLSELRAAAAIDLARAPQVQDEQVAPVVPITSLASAARRSGRRRRVWNAAAAVALVAVGGLGGAAFHTLTQDQPAGGITSVALVPVGGSNVSADLSLTASSWGTSMEWSCDYATDPAGAPYVDVHEYELIVVSDTGERTVVATWLADGDDHASGLLASSAITLENITRVELARVEDDAVLAAADVEV